MPVRLALLVACTLTWVVACTGGGGSATPGGMEGPRPERRDRNTLQRGELAENEQAQLTLYEAIRLHRPHMLRPPTASTLGGAQVVTAVYVEDTRAGGMDVLHRYRMYEVEQVEYLSGSEATTRFGTGHGAGVIIIRLRR